MEQFPSGLLLFIGIPASWEPKLIAYAAFNLTIVQSSVQTEVGNELGIGKKVVGCGVKELTVAYTFGKSRLFFE